MWNIPLVKVNSFEHLVLRVRVPILLVCPLFQNRKIVFRVSTISMKQKIKKFVFELMLRSHYNFLSVNIPNVT